MVLTRESNCRGPQLLRSVRVRCGNIFKKLLLISTFKIVQNKLHLSEHFSNVEIHQTTSSAALST